MDAAEYKFYVKSSPDGRSLGDCPFTQRANLALKLKGVKNVTLVLIDLGNKPEWFKKIANSVPVLERADGALTIADSYQIVQYLDRTYPDPPLDLPGNQEAEKVTSQVFSVFSAWVKNSDPNLDKELEDNMTGELEKIDAFLSKSAGTFLCGDQWSVADCILVPRLFHITVVAQHYKKYSKWESMAKLSRYMDAAFKSDVFKATSYPPEYVLAGWTKYFQ